MKVTRNTSLLWTLPFDVLHRIASYLDPSTREAFYSVWNGAEYAKYHYKPNKWETVPRNNMSIFIEMEEEEQASQKIQKEHCGSYGYEHYRPT